VIQVIVRDLWDHRAGHFKEEPTIGADETPVSEVLDEAKDEGEGDTPGRPVAVSE